jgi:hypothetical protein
MNIFRNVIESHKNTKYFKNVSNYFKPKPFSSRLEICYTNSKQNMNLLASALYPGIMRQNVNVFHLFALLVISLLVK